MNVNIVEKIVLMTEKVNKKYSLGLEDDIADLKKVIELYKTFESKTQKKE